MMLTVQHDTPKVPSHGIKASNKKKERKNIGKIKT